jgi:hypothetical protein
MPQTTDYLSEFKRMDDTFKSSIVIFFIFLILIGFSIYFIYLTRLNSSNCSYMNSLYPSVNGNIRPVSANDPDCTLNLYDYYIKTAFNACSGGSYKNDFVDLCNLKAIIKQGVRCLDFEIYSIDNQPVVSTSTNDSFFIKETFNSVPFGGANESVMNVIQNYAFAGGTCPNPTDPLIIHLRIKSNNQKMFDNLAGIFYKYPDLMLGKDYSFENSGKNIANLPLLTFQRKIILIVDRSNNAFLDNPGFLEYVNLTSNSIFMREYDYYNVKNNPDTQELLEYNRRNMTIVIPDKGANPPNPSSILCRAYGCQMVAMRYQYVDNFLFENTGFFDRSGYAFSLKPENLRYIQVTIPEPTPQNPAYSYGTRNVGTDFYNFNM